MAMSFKMRMCMLMISMAFPLTMYLLTIAYDEGLESSPVLCFAVSIPAFFTLLSLYDLEGIGAWLAVRHPIVDQSLFFSIIGTSISIILYLAQPSPVYILGLRLSFILWNFFLVEALCVPIHHFMAFSGTFLFSCSIIIAVG